LGNLINFVERLVTMSPIRSLFSIAAPLAMLTLGACAPAAFNANVNRFQAMPVAQGQTFAITASDPKFADSLEFSQYAGLVSKKMVGLGYQPAASAASANLVLTLAYGVDEGREHTRSTPAFYDTWYGSSNGRGGYPGHYYGGRGYRFTYGFFDPFLFGAGYDEVERYTVFTSGLELKIDSKTEGKRVFEGKAQALSLSNNLTYLVPNLVEAMFTGFPGNSGETVRITVAQPKKK
jgi:Domain of unknown function (DUF4136)